MVGAGPAQRARPGRSVSDLGPDEQERATVGAQAAPFATNCRVFAPVYTQVTLGQIGAAGPAADARTIAYESALDAWQTYISQHNDGRGVILVGHSQGTGILNQLIANEIDDDPDLRSRLVSAVLLGGAVRVPEGELVGGPFQNVPACTSATEVGCVISFASYPTASPPEDGAVFGLADAIVPVRGPLIGGGDQSAAGDIDTRFVVLPEVTARQAEAFTSG